VSFSKRSRPRAVEVVISFENTYARLPDRFFARQSPTAVSRPRLLALNRPLAEELRIDPDAFDADGWAAVLSGNTVPSGAEPIALAYAGHQFGQLVPQLGDGRAILIGEVVDRAGHRRDIQLKGSGRTPFSRGGDGRAALGPVLREYLVSEAMHALGIPTTRSLAAVATGDHVRREEQLPGAVLARVAASHIRVGTFEFFAIRGDTDGVRRLADYVIDRHYPELRGADQPYLALLEAVLERQAALVARWMGVGFIHGVMNTDNTAISGETIDYGPCAFMDSYDPRTVFSSIDQYGRYAFANQPAIAQWNLARLAETLLPLMAESPEAALPLAESAVAGFAERFQRHWMAVVRAKLGLRSEQEDDAKLADGLFKTMHAGKADYTLTFRRLADAAVPEGSDGEFLALFSDPSAATDWLRQWRERLAAEPAPAEERAAAMRLVNPAFIPRNHKVEEALEAAVEHDDLGPFERLGAVLARPYDDQPAAQAYAGPPEPGGAPYRTFCGT
jgi:uncharacterized protein YdiU (UPF0061 family)